MAGVSGALPLGVGLRWITVGVITIHEYEMPFWLWNALCFLPHSLLVNHHLSIILLAVHANSPGTFHHQKLLLFSINTFWTWLWRGEDLNREGSVWKKIFCNCTKMEVFFKKNKKIKPSFWINVPGQSTRGHLRGLYNAIHLFEVHFTPLNASFGIEAHHHSGSCTFFSRAQVIYSV